MEPEDKWDEQNLLLAQMSGRLAKLLLEMATTDERALTQQEMAARLGTVREIIGRSLRQPETSGLISTERGRIVILDRDELEKLVWG